MFRNYVLLEYDKLAVYQIKVKGSFPDEMNSLFSQQVEITLETTDIYNPITMLTGPVDNQVELMTVLQILHDRGYPILSVACVDVPNKAKLKV